jgi:hypothetical protein
MRNGRAGPGFRVLTVLAVFSLFATFTGCGGGGGDSAPAVTVPDAPSSVTANAGDNSVTLSWSPVTGATSYNLYWATASGVLKTNGTKVSGVQSPNTVSGLVNGTPYYFVVTAVNAAGESGVSAEKTATPSATPPPSAPANIRASAGDKLATISWDAVSGATSYNLYWAASSGVMKTNGTKISGVTTPKDVTGLANGTQYYFVVTAVGAGGESAESAEVFATPVAPPTTFSQADLTGTWDVIIFYMGTSAGWLRATGDVDGSGGVTITSLLDTKGNSLPPGGSIGSMTWTISAAGVVSEGGVNGEPTFHGQMSSNKLLVIGPETPGSTSASLKVCRKRTGTAFDNTDLANKTFTNHWLDTGISATDNTWGYASGTIDGSGLITITSRVWPSGPESPPYPSAGTVSVSLEGIITIPGEPTFYGLMTDDKKVVFYIAGDTIPYEFGVLIITGQTYTQSDLAGTFNFSTIRNTVPNPYWGYGVTVVDAVGNGTYLSFTDILGSPTPANYTRVLSSTGVLTDPADATYHGQLSYNKDINVRTNTSASGRYGLTIGFK